MQWVVDMPGLPKPVVVRVKECHNRGDLLVIVVDNVGEVCHCLIAFVDGCSQMAFPGYATRMIDVVYRMLPAREILGDPGNIVDVSGGSDNHFVPILVMSFCGVAAWPEDRGFDEGCQVVRGLFRLDYCKQYCVDHHQDHDYKQLDLEPENVCHPGTWISKAGLINTTSPERSSDAAFADELQDLLAVNDR